MWGAFGLYTRRGNDLALLKKGFALYNPKHKDVPKGTSTRQHARRSLGARKRQRALRSERSAGVSEANPFVAGLSPLVLRTALCIGRVGIIE